MLEPDRGDPYGYMDVGQWQEFAGETLAIADRVRLAGIVLALLALAALVAAVAVAPDRRVAVLRGAIAVGAVGALLAIALLILRARTLAGVIGEDELTDQEVRDAVAGLVDAYAAGSRAATRTARC